MENIKIGIVGGGFQGKAEAFWFAKRNIDVIIYEINESQIEKIYEDIEASPKKIKYKKYVKVTSNLEDLKNCKLIIENVPENREIKYATLKKIEQVVSEDTIIASNSSSYLPTFLAEALEKKDRFINIHFLGVNWGVYDLELVPSKYTSNENLKLTSQILYDAGFNPIKLKECPGFVFNRINGAELSNLFRAMEEYDLADIDTILRYLLYPIRGQWTVAFIDLLGIEISKALFDYLNEHFGDRIYISKYINGKIERNELGVKTGKGFYEYPSKKIDPTVIVKKFVRNVKSNYNNIFINEASINQLNFLLALIKKGKTIYMDSIDTPCFKTLEKVDKVMYDKIVPYICIAKDSEVKYDLVIDSKILSFDEVVKRIDKLSERFGEDMPIAINTPIYRLEDLASATKHPSDKVAVFNCQKSYICNTELVKNHCCSTSMYDELKNLILELASDCLEVRDGYTRPLMFLIISKVFEAVKCIEEEITTRDNIIRLMQKDQMLKDADYLGLDKLKFISDYLYKMYGQPFEVPQLINDMVKNNKRGIVDGIGFYEYKNYN